MMPARNDHIPHFFARRTFFITTILLSCMFLLSACGGSATGPNTTTTTKKGGNLNVGLIAEPTTLDPLTSASLYDIDIMVNIYDTLFRFDANNTLQPDLATSYVYASPTVLKLNLRSDVKFQDGTPFNADAVIFNIKRFLADKASTRYTDVSDITEITKVSDTQVQINLQKPFAPLLTFLAGNVGLIMSPTAVQKLGDKLGNAPVGVGSGPFLFVEWIKGDHLLLKANPNYWRTDTDGSKLPYIQSVRYHTITNATVMYNNLQTNQIQIATNLDPNNVVQIKNNPSLTYRQIPSPGFASLQINVAQPPLNNLHVRRAIAFGINRQEILDHVLLGVGLVARGPISPASWAYDKSYTGLDYDVTKAKAELAQSGVKNVSFTLSYTGGNPTTSQEMQFIQSQLQAIGITVNLKQETFTALVADFQTTHYQSVFIGWTGGRDPDSTLYSMFTSHGGFSHTNYADPQIDALLDQGRTVANQAQRIPLYQQAQRLIVESGSRIFLIHPVVAQVTSNTVKNYLLSPGSEINLASVYVAS